MEKTQESTTKTITENLYLSNRRNLKIDGIVEIISTSDSSILAKLKDTNLHIQGNGISITRLDITDGILEATGNFELIKYGKSGGIFKKIFK